MNRKIERKKNSDKKKLFVSTAAVLAIVLLIAGLTYAWFSRQTDIATLMQISPPSDISILGPDGKEMTSLDLDYTATDKNGDTVTVRRVICVQSASDKFKLEIVHTTNLAGLELKLYPVTNETTGNNSVTDGGKTFAYSNSPVPGEYLNVESDSTKIYKYANSDMHNKNYDSYDKVQLHAEPVYWLTNECQANLSGDVTITNGIENKTYHRTFYVCEVSWTETTKETDIFYILAQPV